MSLAWLYQFKLDLFPEVKWAARSGIAGVRNTFRSEVPPTDLGKGREPNRQSVFIPWSETNLADQPSANRRLQRQNCLVSPIVRNGAAENSAPSFVVLEFSFLNGLGNPMGMSVRATSDEMLSAGKEHKLTFEVPCPTTLATIKVQPIANHISIRAALPSERRVVIDDAAGRIRDKPYFTVRIPDPAKACPAEDPCTLVLRMDPQGLRPITFERDPAQPTALLSHDPELIQYLTKGRRAQLEVPTADGMRMIGLGQENVIRTEKLGMWRRFRDWLTNSGQALGDRW